MYIMLTLSFQDQGLISVVLESSSTTQGPFWPRAVLIDGTPGPPESHIDSGAFWGSSRASKNQKYIWLAYFRFSAGLGGRLTYPL
jgi:hypothetical protein